MQGRIKNRDGRGGCSRLGRMTNQGMLHAFFLQAAKSNQLHYSPDVPNSVLCIFHIQTATLYNTDPFSFVFRSTSPFFTMSVTLHTNVGDLKIEVFCESVPKTAEVGAHALNSGLSSTLTFYRTSLLSVHPATMTALPFTASLPASWPRQACRLRRLPENPKTKTRAPPSGASRLRTRSACPRSATTRAALCPWPTRAHRRPAAVWRAPMARSSL